MEMDTIGNQIIENEIHHSFKRWRNMDVRDDYDDEWDDRVSGSETSLSPLPVDLNVGLQRMIQNVNAIQPRIGLPVRKPHDVGPIVQQNLIDMTLHCRNTKLNDHTIEVMQQILTIVENVQT